MTPENGEKVRDGSKTVTRRIESSLKEINENPDDLTYVKVANEVDIDKKHKAEIGDYFFVNNDDNMIAYLIKPRYKVGEIVQLVWKPESNYVRFDFHGDGALTQEQIDKGLNVRTPTFPKIIRTVRITDVQKIEINKGICYQETGLHCIEGKTGVECLEIAKLDGFPDVKTFVEWMDNYADLSTAKLFWRYILEEVDE